MRESSLLVLATRPTRLYFSSAIQAAHFFAA
jgi:hypothetical protein